MEQGQIAMWYFIIGLVYSFINGFVRKIDTDGNYLYGLVWFVLWPIGFLSLGVLGITKMIKKFK